MAFPSAQAGGDLNVVFVGWDQATSGVQSVRDTAGNTYVAASAQLVNPAGATLIVYYAKNIEAAATNTVTVTFNNSVSFPDIRVLEFSGIRTDYPLDVVAGAIGNGPTLNSGPLTTTTANDLLVASGYVQHTYSGGAGAGYTRILVSAWNLVEDAVTTSVGTYSATSSDSSGYWVMQQLAFRAINTSSDVTPPTVPSGLVVTAASNNQLNLSWSASSDAFGVTGYLIERCPGAGCSNFMQIGATGGTTYQDSGLSPSTPYTYRIRASDAAGNLSAYSRSSGDTTLLGYPAFVQGNSGTLGSVSTVNVSFPSAQVAGDLNVVFVGWNQATSTVQSVTDTKGNTYVAAVGPTINSSGATQVVYYARNILAAPAGSNTATVTFSSSVSSPDVRILELSGIDPNNPLDVATAATGNGATLNSGPLTTTAPIDLLVASGYVQHSYTGGAGAGYTQILVSAWNLVEDALVTSTGTYSATSSDSSGYWVMQQVAFRATYANTTPPSVPGSLTAGAASSSQINLQWAQSTSSVGMSAYLIERCQGAGCTNFTTVAAAATTNYDAMDLTASTSYTYRVRARDVVGNLSDYSTNVTVATLASGASSDTTSPTIPTQLTVTAISGNQINFNWTASTDDVGVAGYLVESCQGASCTNFVQVGAPATASFAGTGLAPATTYTFRVRATDAAGNLSDYSIPVSAVTSTSSGVCN